MTDAVVTINSNQQEGSPDGGLANIEMLMDVAMQVTVELGRTELPVREVLDLQKGSVIELDRLAGEPVDIYVNNSRLALGEVVVVDDKFGVRITQLLNGEGKDV